MSVQLDASRRPRPPPPPSLRWTPRRAGRHLRPAVAGAGGENARPAHGRGEPRPVLYALVRFVKPKTVLEIGAGYTSLFLLQALRDNDEELAFLRREKRADREAGHLGIADEGGQKPMAGMPRRGVVRPAGTRRCSVAVRSALRGRPVARVLHRAGNKEDRRATGRREAPRDVRRGRVGGRAPACRPKLSTGRKGWRSTAVAGPVDMLWVDFGVGDRLDAFLRLYWPSVAPGGFVVVHSTVTNRATRAWLERAPRRVRVARALRGRRGRKREEGRRGEDREGKAREDRSEARPRALVRPP